MSAGTTTSSSNTSIPFTWSLTDSVTSTTNTHHVPHTPIMVTMNKYDAAAERLVETHPRTGRPEPGEYDDELVRELVHGTYGKKGHRGGAPIRKKYAVVVRMMFDPSRNPRLRASDTPHVLDELQKNAGKRGGKYKSTSKKGAYHSWLFEFDTEEQAREFARENIDIKVPIEGVPYDVSLDADAFQGDREIK